MSAGRSEARNCVARVPSMAGGIDDDVVLVVVFV